MIDSKLAVTVSFSMPIQLKSVLDEKIGKTNRSRLLQALIKQYLDIPLSEKERLILHGSKDEFQEYSK